MWLLKSWSFLSIYSNPCPYLQMAHASRVSPIYIHFFMHQSINVSKFVFSYLSFWPSYQPAFASVTKLFSCIGRATFSRTVIHCSQARLKYVTGLGKVQRFRRKFAPNSTNKAKNLYHRWKNHTNEKHHNIA